MLQRVINRAGNVFPGTLKRMLCTQKAPATKSYNCDKDELKHHETIIDWWDVNGPMKALHAMNNVRVPLVRNSLVNAKQIGAADVNKTPTYLMGKQILDVGCGSGILSEALARVGGNVTGLDPSEELIKRAREHAEISLGNSSPTYISSTVEQHAELNRNVYDAVVASEVVEHVPDKESFIKGCISVLKPGGSLIMTTPNRTWASWLGGIILAEYILNIIPKGTHHYEKFIKPTELSSLIEKNGCKVLSVNGLVYDIARNEWRWVRTTVLLYALHAIKSRNA